MANKSLIVLILLTIVSGIVFAQTDFETMPKNTIVVDIGPTIAGMTFGMVGNMIGGGVSSSGFGIAAQYERQILRQLSVAGRFAYMGVSFDMKSSYQNSGTAVNTSLGIDLTAISLEAHVRYYPLGETFFLGGMLGYGNLSVAFSGEVAAKDNSTEEWKSESVSYTVPRSYFKLGARLGWRINFGRQGGFTFEPSFGYDLAMGLGDTLGKGLQNAVGEEMDTRGMDELFKILEDFIFVGGPRLTLAFGWRF